MRGAALKCIDEDEDEKWWQQILMRMILKVVATNIDEDDIESGGNKY